MPFTPRCFKGEAEMTYSVLWDFGSFSGPISLDCVIVWLVDHDFGNSLGMYIIVYIYIILYILHIFYIWITTRN
jgi:hypothetical protein